MSWPCWRVDKKIVEFIMGAWGPGSFENDAALDFTDDVNDLALVEAVLKRQNSNKPDHDYADEDVLVAAEIVAAMMKHSCSHFPENLIPKVDVFGAASDALIGAATRAVETIRDGSELAELWDESGDEEWRAAIDHLLLRLDPNTDYVAPDPPEFQEPGEIGFGCILCGQDGTQDQEVKLTIEKDDGIVAYSYTHYAHRDCLQSKFDAPHFNEDGSPHADLIARLDAFVEGGME
jgi:hypothetical protein